MFFPAISIYLSFFPAISFRAGGRAGGRATTGHDVSFFPPYLFTSRHFRLLKISSRHFRNFVIAKIASHQEENWRKYRHNESEHVSRALANFPTVMMLQLSPIKFTMSCHLQHSRRLHRILLIACRMPSHVACLRYRPATLTVPMTLPPHYGSHRSTIIDRPCITFIPPS